MKNTYVDRILFGAMVAILGLAGFAMANGGHEETGSTADAMMRMDTMMHEEMTGNASEDCPHLTSGDLVEKGEELMSKMLEGDEVRHERIETVMEEGGEEFHDAMHTMMGRVATGCFTDDEQKAIAAKLSAVPQNRSGQAAPLATGLIIGILGGMIVSSFIKKKSV